MVRVKYWEMIADNLSKAGWSWAASQAWIRAGERSSLLTRIVTTVAIKATSLRSSDRRQDLHS